jgi:3-hydroxyisobutyrate dehydrogenase-like beta-hydroxyacid dehydrogenase
MATSSSSSSHKVAFIGFGEAAQAFVAGWGDDRPTSITAYDIKFVRDATRAQKCADYEDAGVEGCAKLADALAASRIVFSMVTADQVLVAAEDAAAVIQKDIFYFDCNSCAPHTKQEAAKLIEAAGGHYMDVAVMAPVHPGLHQTPVLVSGTQHGPALKIMADLDMNATHAPGDVGAASSIKMIRSIMVKGLEALTLECLLSARKAGVSAEVLQSLERSYPGFGWTKRVSYMLQRTMVHGQRRAEELREVASTVEALDLPNDMAKAIVEWQQRIGDLGLRPASDDSDLLADQILAEETSLRAHKEIANG